MKRSPIDMMIDASVKCIRCGSSIGGCDCALKMRVEREAKRDAWIEAETTRLLALPDDEFESECRALGVWIGQ